MSPEPSPPHSQRNVRIIARDRLSLGLMIAAAPLVASFDAFRWRSGLFDNIGGEPQAAMTNMFFAVMFCVLIGALSAMREIVKEADVYKRERMVALQIVPYAASKFALVTVLSLYQASMLVISKQLIAGWPPTFEGTMQVYVTLSLVVLAGTMMGLLVSAISPNQNSAPFLLIPILVLNIMFGGILPFKSGGQAAKVVANLAPTKWGFEAMMTISGFGKSVALDPCWQLPVAERDKLTEKDKIEQCNCMGPNMFSKGQFPGMGNYYDPVVDAPEPQAPAKLAEPPSAPPRPVKPSAGATPAEQMNYQDDMQKYEQAIDAYQKKMDQYQQSMKTYQSAVDTWKDSYQKWKEGRSKAIGSAEAVVRRYWDDYGQTFNVNVAGHWFWLGFIIMALFGMMVAWLRFVKDRRK